MLIIVAIISLLYVFTRNKIDTLYFEPESARNIDTFITHSKYRFIKNDNHYALFRKGYKSHKVLIVAHGNAGSFMERDYVFDKLGKYSGDIYLFEYPGFSGVDGKANITNCVNETLYWINHLSPKYEKIDLFGESIGGGVIVETCVRYSLTNINKIYLQSTFTSMKDVIKNINYGLYVLYNFMLLDDLNTANNLKRLSCNKYVIIHSPTDKLINYSQALKNYDILKKLGKQVRFIEGFGNHGNTHFML